MSLLMVKMKLDKFSYVGANIMDVIPLIEFGLLCLLCCISVLARFLSISMTTPRYHQSLEPQQNVSAQHMFKGIYFHLEKERFFK
jgi:hypothetical protein